MNSLKSTILILWKHHEKRRRKGLREAFASLFLAFAALAAIAMFLICGVAFKH